MISPEFPNYSTREEWERVAPVYKTPHIHKEHIRKPAFLHELGDVRGRRMLDLGCGDGYYSRLMAEAGAEVLGVDFSQTSIDLARAQEEQNPNSIQYACVDIAKMDFLPTAEFDGAVADLVFITFPTQEKYTEAIREVHRVLKVGGTVLVSRGHPARFNRSDKSKDFSLPDNQEPSYFASLIPRRITMDIEGQSVSWTNYHRTLEDFVNPWLENGFVITKVVEPRPTQEGLKKFPDQLQGTGKLPYYIIFTFKKIEAL